jgi:hypothetical protein
VYWDTANNRFDLALADGSAKQAAVGFSDIVNGAVYALGDAMLFTGFTPGHYYLSGTVAGAITSTIPSSNVVSVGVAKSATEMFIDIDGAYGITQIQADARYAALNGSNANAFNVGPATAASHAVQQSQAFGIGQTRQNVTASRTLGTNYVNSTGKAIEVTVQAGLVGGNGLYIADDSGVNIKISGNSSTIIYLSMSAIIPPGGNYSVAYFAGSSSTSLTWLELR